MKKDIKIKITNEDGSVKQNTKHEIHFETPVWQFDPEIAKLADEALKKFKDSGELADEVIITESYFYS